MLKQLKKHNLFKTIGGILSIAGIYSALFAMDYFDVSKETGTICIFKRITTIPCPGCGMGRGTLAIFEGNFSEAFSFNILCIPITIGMFISLCWLLIDLLLLKRDTFFKTVNQPIKIKYLIPFFILTATSWIINITRGI